MRIYNGTNAQISLPYPGKRVEVAAHSISGDLGANTDSISLLVTGYTTDEIALVVSGPYELNLCSSIPTVTSYVVQSIEEAIARFSPKSEELHVEKEKAHVSEEEIKSVPSEDYPECGSDCEKKSMDECYCEDECCCDEKWKCDDAVDEEMPWESDKLEKDPEELEKAIKELRHNFKKKKK